MNPQRRIPNVIGLFNQYIVTTDNTLQKVISAGPPAVTNWQRLGLNQQSADEWHSRRMHWEDTLHRQYSNPLTKTASVNAQVQTFMKDFTAFCSPLLNLMAAGFAATEGDSVIFRFKIGRKNPSHAIAPIVHLCFLSLQTLGGCMVKISCRQEHSTKRPSLPAGADSVMLAYQTGDPAPENANECTHTVIVTRAASIHSIGLEHAAKQLHVFARYYSTKHPELAGPWSWRSTMLLW